jgi:hypothetical protein
MGIKFNRNVIVASKFPDGNEVLDNRWRNEYIVQGEGGRICGNGGGRHVCHRQLGTISDGDGSGVTTTK